MVECDLAKVDVAGSNPVSRSNFRFASGLASFGRSVKSFKWSTAAQGPLKGTWMLLPGCPAIFGAKRRGFRVQGRCGSLVGGWSGFTMASNFSAEAASSRLKQQAAVSDWVHRPRASAWPLAEGSTRLGCIADATATPQNWRIKHRRIKYRAASAVGRNQQRAR